jgi:hypothetical protein
MNLKQIVSLFYYLCYAVLLKILNSLHQLFRVIINRMGSYERSHTLLPGFVTESYLEKIISRKHNESVLIEKFQVNEIFNSGSLAKYFILNLFYKKEVALEIPKKLFIKASPEGLLQSGFFIFLKKALLLQNNYFLPEVKFFEIFTGKDLNINIPICYDAKPNLLLMVIIKKNF